MYKVASYDIMKYTTADGFHKDLDLLTMDEFIGDMQELRLCTP